MTKVIKSLLRFAVASAVLAGLSQAAHAAALPNSANVADGTVKRVNQATQAVNDAEQAAQKNSHTTVSPSSSNTNTPPAAGDSLGQSNGTLTNGITTPSDSQNAKSNNGSNTEAIASSASDLKNLNTTDNPANGTGQDQSNATNLTAIAVDTPSSPPSGTGTAASHWRAETRSTHVTVGATSQPPLATPAPSSAPSVPSNGNAPFNPLTAGSLILNLAQTATLVSYHQVLTGLATLHGAWPLSLPSTSLVIIALVSLALLSAFVGIVALWRRSGYARAPRSASTNLIHFATPESWRVLSPRSLFWSQFNPTGVNR